jgi:metacaspase-1
MAKRALCIGINYVGTSAQLAGCANDANDWTAALEARGFAVGALLDEQATRDRMLAYMADLIAETGPDDLAVITYSGHGSWQVDRSGDEADRRDEVLCPVDYSRSGMISDDDLYRVFTSGHRWARVVFISDSCHSGTVNRLAPPLDARYVHEGASPTEAWTRKARFLPPAEWIDDEDTLYEARRVELAPSRGRPRASALLMAACTDTQVAYDAWFDGRANGAYSYAALKALEENPATYRDWQRGINTRLPSVDYDQAPRLEAGSGQRRWLVFEEQGER